MHSDFDGYLSFLLQKAQIEPKPARTSLSSQPGKDKVVPTPKPKYDSHSHHVMHSDFDGYLSFLLQKAQIEPKPALTSLSSQPGKDKAVPTPKPKYDSHLHHDQPSHPTVSQTIGKDCSLYDSMAIIYDYIYQQLTTLRNTRQINSDEICVLKAQLADLQKGASSDTDLDLGIKISKLEHELSQNMDSNLCLYNALFPQVQDGIFDSALEIKHIFAPFHDIVFDSHTAEKHALGESTLLILMLIVFRDYAFCVKTANNVVHQVYKLNNNYSRIVVIRHGNCHFELDNATTANKEYIRNAECINLDIFGGFLVKLVEHCT